MLTPGVDFDSVEEYGASQSFGQGPLKGSKQNELAMRGPWF